MELVYQSSPIVTLATNTFENVPILFQFEDTPMTEIVKAAELGYTSSIPIYHGDGTYLAKIVGTRVYPTEDGKAAKIEVKKYRGVWICELDKKVAFEILHQRGDAFKLTAELYAPGGYFVKIKDEPTPQLIDFKGSAIKVGGVLMNHSAFRDVRIGIWLRKDGSCALGCA